MKKQKHQTVLITPGQTKEVAGFLSESIPVDVMKKERAQWILGHKGLVGEEIVDILLNFEPDFLVELKLKMERVLSKKFNKRIKVTDPPLEFTEENLARWAKMNFHPIYFPTEQISQDRQLKDWIKLEDWFYQRIKKGKIKQDADNLYPGWYLADFTQGVDYTDENQVSVNDPLSPIIKELREQGKVGKYDNTPLGSRFSIVSQNEWPVVCQVVLQELGVDSKRATCRLERCIEFNAIGNLFDANRGKFDTWEWFDDIFGDINRLIGGNRSNGGLPYVNAGGASYRHNNIAGRPLVSFA